ncbi:coiled-coil domain-containing protein 172 isoform X2 [Melanotaenia boesemani]|uniref:coiled-coil domain-containing protein 172 isoform X2 n=1 Tax=Melanotaenia boesemani TaxID=1250792 RepID=UPI001C05A210|nr:coiled-coil domain-containing protein 172 isoform X2 [Melanotaenia boesemani]
MSLDSLFQQILLTEQQLTEQTKKFKEVKVAIIKCNEKIKDATEKYEKTKEELDKKAQQLSSLRLQSDLMKKSEDQMLKQIEELICQRNQLRQREVKIRRESKEEEENFLQEISRFNCDFSLQGNGAALLESQTHAELLALDREVESLHKEMELLSRRNAHMSSVEEEKRVLLLELQGLDNIQKDMDQQLKEAQAMTETLRLESKFVSQKHLTDSTCVRLRKELEMHEDGELEHLRHTLSSEVQILQSSIFVTCLA